MNKHWQKERNSEPLVNWTSDTASHKRKRQDRDGQDLQPPKQSKGPLKINWRNVAQIVKELGHLVLAITLAGSYVSETARLSSDIRWYLPEYRERRKNCFIGGPSGIYTNMEKAF